MKFTEQERDFLKQEFADLCHAAINSMITAGSFVRSIDRIEAIVSERITPEAGESVKPIPSIPIVGGGSVASDRTEPGESGQSAEDVESIFYKLCDIARRDGASIEYLTKPNAIEAMRLHASQVCADKEQEIDRINESLTVMVNRNAELEKELEYAKIR